MIEFLHSTAIPINERSYELVERKGLAHPDTLIDGIMEAISCKLSSEYLKYYGKILHHNVDKGQLCGGATHVEFGGGTFLKPVFILLGGRAKSTKEIDAPSIAVKTAREYLSKTTRFLKSKDVEILSKISRGAPELEALLRPKIPLANDSSICVGFAPQSELEQIVLKVEQTLNSKPFKEKYPEVGEDIKVLGYRNRNKIALVLAAAFVSKFVSSIDDYHSKKERLRENVKKIAEGMTEKEIDVVVNGADKGKSIYLTLTGLSCEMGDDGNAGRGNRPNGLITPCRPMAIESVAGKNPVCHVGKVYYVLAFQLANKIVELGAKECNIYIHSKIGMPINKPAATVVELIWDKEKIKENENKMKKIIQEGFDSIPELTVSIVKGKIPVF